MSEQDVLDEAEVKSILREGFVGFSKEIAGLYVKPLLDEKILKVTKDHIQIMGLLIPRERVVFFHIALTQLRSPNEMYPIRQGKNGFTVEKAKAARGNDVVDAYRITSNAADGTSILLTKKLAWELWEVIAFFIPKADVPSDNPLPKTVDSIGWADQDRSEMADVEQDEWDAFTDDFEYVEDFDNDDEEFWDDYEVDNDTEEEVE